MPSLPLDNVAGSDWAWVCTGEGGEKVLAIHCSMVVHEEHIGNGDLRNCLTDSTTKS